MEKTTVQKWYNNEMLVDVLLFFLPPMGMYAIYKTNLLKNKTTKILYGLIGFSSFLVVIIYLSK